MEGLRNIALSFLETFRIDLERFHGAVVDLFFKLSIHGVSGNVFLGNHGQCIKYLNWY